MTKRIAALFVIFTGATLAWMVLGATIFARTESLESLSGSRVESTWGSAQWQKPPAATWEETRTEMREVSRDDEKGIAGKRLEKVTYRRQVELPLEQSRIKVNIFLDHRKKGLLWYSTYGVDLAGDYLFRNNTDQPRQATLTLPLPAERAVYDNLSLKADGEPLSFTTAGNAVSGSVALAPGQTVKLSAAYHSQGMNQWHYSFGQNISSVRDFQLLMTTNFRAIDFPENTLSPTAKQQAGIGWQLAWDYKNLISGFEIGMKMPDKLQPGPLAGRISFFAPVSLFFFFFILFVITTIRGVEIHPMNYFFLAAAFFAFHLLLAYLVDHISIHLAFVICSIVSIALVVSYLRLVVGSRFAFREAVLAQFVYLVLFSYAFFFEGFTGLSVTIGAIVTLFVAMQATGRINWAEKFQKPVGGLRTRESFLD
jgi:Inner membrane protein CreD